MISNEHLEAMGRIAYADALLDETIEQAIWHFNGGSYDILATTHMTKPHRRNVLMAIVVEKFPKDTALQEGLKALLKESETITVERNGILHNVLREEASDPKIATYVKRTVYGKWNAKRRHETPESINDIADRMAEIAFRISGLLGLDFFREPSPDIPPQQNP